MDNKDDYIDAVLSSLRKDVAKALSVPYDSLFDLGWINRSDWGTPLGIERKSKNIQKLIMKYKK